MAKGNLSTMLSEVKEGNIAPFFKIKDGEQKRIRLLVDLAEGAAAYVHNIHAGGRFRGGHTCIDEGCPACEADVKKTFRGWLLAWDYTQNENKGGVVILAGGQRMMKALQVISSAYGVGTFRDLVVKRVGEKFDTQYTVYPALSPAMVADILKGMPDDTPVDVEAILVGGHPGIKGALPGEEVVEGVKKFFELEELSPKTIFVEIQEKAAEILDRLSAPPTVEDMAAILRGENPKKSPEDVEEEAAPGTKAAGESVFTLPG